MKSLTQTITYPEVPGKGAAHQPLVRHDYPVHWLEPGSEVRCGFEKGTLSKATFELASGCVITYEVEDG